MKVLVACEESQVVCSAFREQGHQAFSCDIVPCRFTDHPEWHIMCDVFEIIDGYTNFYTQDGEIHDEVAADTWDLIIAHPPCTYLTVTGNRWFDVTRYGEKARQRERERECAVNFFIGFTKVNCKRMAIENPVGCMSTYYRKPDQIIQPYYFGDPYRKTTCLWLKNLPKLEPTKIVEPEIYYYQAKNGKIKSDSKWRMKVNDENRSKVRSRTFPGTAKAMAEQWGNN